ncbi:hypothetical protein ACIBIZ_31330 [Nonomuraea spiralis]|uniref:hypothetical protein n=1 Tax=Nonomuraea spiralis TaxID=46182 RepID=UPI0037AB5654
MDPEGQERSPRTKQVTGQLRQAARTALELFVIWLAEDVRPVMSAGAAEIVARVEKSAGAVKAEWVGLAPGKQAENEERAKSYAERLSAISALDPGQREKTYAAIEDCTRCLLATRWRVHPLNDPFFERNRVVFGVQATLLGIVAVIFVVIPFFGSLTPPNVWTMAAYLMLYFLYDVIHTNARRLLRGRLMTVVRLGVFAVLLLIQIRPEYGREFTAGIAVQLKALSAGFGLGTQVPQLQAIDWAAVITGSLRVVFGVLLLSILLSLLGRLGHLISGQTSPTYTPAESAMALSIYQVVHVAKLLDDATDEGAYVPRSRLRGLGDALESVARTVETLWVRSQRTGVRAIDSETRRLGARLAFRIRQYRSRAVLGGDRNLLEMRDFFVQAAICAVSGEWRQILGDAAATEAPTGVGLVRTALSRVLTTLLPVPAAWVVITCTDVVPAEAHGLLLLGAIIFTLVQIATWLDPGAVTSFEVAGKVRDLLRK